MNKHIIVFQETEIRYYQLKVMKLCYDPMHFTIYFKLAEPNLLFICGNTKVIINI